MSVREKGALVLSDDVQVIANLGEEQEGILCDLIDPWHISNALNARSCIRLGTDHGLGMPPEAGDGDKNDRRSNHLEVVAQVGNHGSDRQVFRNLLKKAAGHSLCLVRSLETEAVRSLLVVARTRHRLKGAVRMGFVEPLAAEEGSRGSRQVVRLLRAARLRPYCVKSKVRFASTVRRRYCGSRNCGVPHPFKDKSTFLEGSVLKIIMGIFSRSDVEELDDTLTARCVRFEAMSILHRDDHSLSGRSYGSEERRNLSELEQTLAK